MTEQIKPYTISIAKKEATSSLPFTAVFIDGDWLVHATRKLQQHLDFSQLLNSLRDSFGVSTEVRIYISTNPDRDRDATFVPFLRDLGYIVHAMPVVRQGGRMYSKGLDVQLAADATALPRQVDRLVLVSGDADFVPLIQSASNRGRSTVLIALPLVVSRALVEIIDHFATVEDLLQPSHDRSIRKEQVPKEYLPRQSYVQKGNHLDAYLLIRGIITGARESLTIVDPYINDELFMMLPLVGIKVEVTVLTNRIQAPDYENILRKLRKEGHNISIYKTKDVHDRFIQVDDQFWHSGHSLKDLGSKDSMLNRVEEQEAIGRLRQRIADVIQSSAQLFPPEFGG